MCENVLIFIVNVYYITYINVQGTANAKDSEVIKKVHGFWVIQLKNCNMSLQKNPKWKCFYWGKVKKYFKLKCFFITIACFLE